MYTNSSPHIGFAFESIQADVIARYHRLLDKDTLFLTGTDEHGTKVAKAAKKAGKRPKEFVDEISKKVMKLKEVLNLSNDDFIRTSDRKRHWPAVKKVWLELKEAGDIYKKKYQAFYCSGCEAFITKKDLIDGKCAIHQTKPEIIDEENYFFKLSKYAKKIEEAIEKGEMRIIPETRKNEILSFIRQGLKDVSFSRPREKLQWGIPVPDNNNQTIYVWADALTNYISALGYYKETEKFKKNWPADVHVIGKDILRFHAVIWPGMLLSLKLPLPKTIFVHGFITVNSQKMSKSLGNVIDPFELVKRYGTDAVRYFLLREIPPTDDGDFTYEKFEKRYNADLASGLGNLVARVMTMVAKLNPKFERISSKRILNPNLQRLITETQKNYHNALNNFKFNDALASIWDLISFCDEYIEKEKPWEFFKNQKLKIKSQKIISDLFLALKEIARILQPFLPETAGQIFKKIKTKETQPLFPRIK